MKSLSLRCFVLVLAWSFASAAHLEPQYGRVPFLTGGAVDGGFSSWGVVGADVDGLSRVCEQAFGDVMLSSVRVPDGAILAAGFTGFLRTTDLGCTWTSLTDNGVGERAVTALWQNPQDGQELWVGTSAPQAPNGILHSVDGGASFTSVLPDGEFDVFSVQVSSTGRVVAGGATRTGTPILWLSDDGLVFERHDDLFADMPLVRALTWRGDDAVVGGFNNQGQGYLEVVQGPAASPTRAVVGNATAEIRFAAVLNDQLYALVPVRGEVLRFTDGNNEGEVLTGPTTGPTDCLLASADGSRLLGCGRQVGLASSLFLSSVDGAAWVTEVGLFDVEYRLCPQGTIGQTACVQYIEAQCVDGVDDDLDGTTDCDDRDCTWNALCEDGEGEGEGEGEVQGEGEGEGATEGEGDNDDPDPNPRSSCCTGMSSAWLSGAWLLWARVALRRRVRDASAR
jgi:hypothetical protein